MKKVFIEVTAIDRGNNKLYLSVDGVGSISRTKKTNYGLGGDEMCTRIGHISHNNGGYLIQESVEEVLYKVQLANERMNNS